MTIKYLRELPTASISLSTLVGVSEETTDETYKATIGDITISGFVDNQPKMKATLSDNYTVISTYQYTEPMPFNVVEYDIGNGWDNNEHKYTIPLGGMYLISLVVLPMFRYRPGDIQIEDPMFIIKILKGASTIYIRQINKVYLSTPEEYYKGPWNGEGALPPIYPTESFVYNEKNHSIMHYFNQGDVIWVEIGRGNPIVLDNPVFVQQTLMSGTKTFLSITKLL